MVYGLDTHDFSKQIKHEDA